MKQSVPLDEITSSLCQAPRNDVLFIDFRHFECFNEALLNWNVSRSQLNLTISLLRT